MKNFFNYTIEQKHRYFESLFSKVSDSLQGDQLSHYMKMTTSESHDLLDRYYDKVSVLIASGREQAQTTLQHHLKNLADQESTIVENEQQECLLLLDELN